VAHFEFLMASSLVDGVILSVAVLQAERRISRLTGAARKPNCTTTEIQNRRESKTEKFKTLGKSRCRKMDWQVNGIPTQRLKANG